MVRYPAGESFDDAFDHECCRCVAAPSSAFEMMRPARLRVPLQALRRAFGLSLDATLM
jgi:hypothetical protein